MDRPRRRRRGRAADGPRWRRGYIATPRREGIVRGSDRRPRYLRQILSQLKTWLDTGEVQRLVVVVTGVETGTTLERWVFGVNACAPGDDAARPRGDDDGGRRRDAEARRRRGGAAARRGGAAVTRR